MIFYTRMKIMTRHSAPFRVAQRECKRRHAQGLIKSNVKE